MIAQDRPGSGAGGSVRLRFHDSEQVWREASAREVAQLRSFTRTFLKCAWFNAVDEDERHLRIFVLNPGNDGTPGSVRLHVHEGEAIAHKAAVHDLDRIRVTALVKQFFKLGWF